MNVRLTLACLASLAIAPACTAWHPVAIPPPPAGEEVRIRHLRVTERGMGRIELRDARLTADSVIGQRPGVGRVEGRIAIDRERVRLLERTHLSVERTFALVGIVAVVVVRWVAEGIVNGAL